jgi:hypothetical protein
LSSDIAEKSRVKEVLDSCGSGAEFPEVGGDDELALGLLLPQAAMINAALLATAVAATALVTERKVNHLVFGRGLLSPRGQMHVGVTVGR